MPEPRDGDVTRPDRRSSSGGRLRVTCVLSEFPLPRDRGGQLRNIGILAAVAREHAVHILSPRRSDTTESTIEELARLVDGPVETFEPRRSRGGGALGVATWWVQALLTGKPPWALMAFTRELRNRLMTLARSSDLILFLEGGADGCPAALCRLSRPPVLMVDKHGVGVAWSATIEHGRRTPLHGLRHSTLLAITKRSERVALRRADYVVVTSPEESDRMAKLYGRTPDGVVPSGVHLPAQVTPNGGRRVGFLGGLDYPPNHAGLTRFLEEGWPALAAQGLKLVVGGRLGDQVPVPTSEGVEIWGAIGDDDLPSFLAELAVAVVPLWEGGTGVKLKTLTLMGAALPVVATPMALIGIPAVHRQHCLIANDAGGLADAVLELVSDRELATRIGAAGRQLVAEQFTWARLGPRYLEEVERAMHTCRRSCQQMEGSG